MPSAVVGTRPPETYDAEYHIGLQADDDNASVAEANTAVLSAALEAQWAGGSFDFDHGQAGPVLRPISFTPKEFFFKGTLTTSARYGGDIRGAGAGTVPLSSAQRSEAGSLGGMTTCFTRIDGEAGGAVLRLRGSNFNISRIEFRGRPYATDLDNGPSGGTKTPTAIEVECRADRATGGHVLRDCLLSECTYGVRLLGGYYSDITTFVAGEQFSYNGLLDNVRFFGVNNCFRSENQLAVGWQLRNIDVGGWDSSGLIAVIVCDIARGGNIAIDGLNINNRRTTLFQIQDYSASTRRLICDNLRANGMNVAGDDYLTLFKYNGSETAASALRWIARISGQIVGDDVSPSYDVTKLIQVSTSAVGFPLDDIRIDVDNLPSNGFQREGRWFVPTPALL